MKALSIGELGEENLVARILAMLPSGSHCVIPAGDDCAALAWTDQELLLFKTDALIEGVHFLPETDATLVGRKAAARCVSDIAAMGGIPMQATVAIALPGWIEVKWVDNLYHGILALGQEHSFGVCGGETSRCDGPRAIIVSMLGRVAAKDVVRRSGGRAGDRLFVTGRLGGSFVSGRHLTFVPRVREAQWLVQNVRPTAMMDLSDGLAADLPRLAKASGVGFSLWRERLPLHEGSDPQAGLSDGEDYELLFAAEPTRLPDPRAWVEAFPEVSLTEIGLLTEQGVGDSLAEDGYHHFA